MVRRRRRGPCGGLDHLVGIEIRVKNQGAFLAAAKALVAHCVPVEGERRWHVSIDRAIGVALRESRNHHGSQLPVLVINVVERVPFLLHIVLCRQTAALSKGCQSSSLQASLPLTKNFKGGRGIDARSRGRRARDRPRRSALAEAYLLVARVPHAQDHGLSQRCSAVSRQVRGVDKVRQGCDLQRLGGTVVSDHLGPKQALGVLFEVNGCPVDGCRPVWVLYDVRL